MRLTPEQYRELQTVFSEVILRKEDEREAFLTERCPLGSPLRPTLDVLLRMDESEGESLSRGAAALFDSVVADLESSSVPDFIGPYKVVGTIGRGGMGVVYEAEQPHPHRIVAVKLLRAGLTDPELLQRFAREADILARLTDPRIARVFDAGCIAVDSLDLPGGSAQRPYLVMERVIGEPVTDFSEKRDLSLADRLRLVARIAGGVHHAHQRGVIHRDLKPANILIEEDGSPKILDFGVARSLDRPESPIETRWGHMLGTLAYMSPEQAMGQITQIGAPSDVYSLGVLCYELLTGRVPIDLEGLPLHEVVEAIVKREPRRPGTRLPAARGDLDLIVLTALAKDPDRRYASASEFAADIRRFLDHQPITARAPTFGYQLAKLIRRRPLLFTSTAALLLLFAFSAYLFIDRAGHRSKSARLFRSLHDLSKSTLYDSDRAIARVPGTTLAREQLLSQAVEYLGRLAADAGDDPELWEDIGRGRVAVAKICGHPFAPNLGRLSKALDHYGHSSHACDRLEALGRGQPARALRAEIETGILAVLWSRDSRSDMARQFQRATSAVDALGEEPSPSRVSLEFLAGMLDLEVGRVAEARSHWQQALRCLTLEPETDVAREASLRLALARASQLLGDTVEAVAEVDRVKEQLERALSRTPYDGFLQQLLGRSRLVLGRHLATTGRLSEANDQLEEAIEALADLSARDLGDMASRLALADARQSYAACLTWQFRFPESDRQLALSRAVLDQLIGTADSSRQARQRLTRARLQQATADLDRGRYDSAIEVLEQIREELQGAVKMDPESYWLRKDLAACLVRLGFAYGLHDRVQDGENRLAEAREVLLDEREQFRFPFHGAREQATTVLSQSGSILQRKGSHEASMRYLLRACDERRRLVSESPSDLMVLFNLALDYSWLAATSQLLGDGEAAERSYLEALGIEQELVRRAPEDRRFAQGLVSHENVLGDRARDAGDFESALEHYARGASIAEQLYSFAPQHEKTRRDWILSNERLYIEYSRDETTRTLAKGHLETARDLLLEWYELAPENPQAIEDVLQIHRQFVSLENRSGDPQSQRSAWSGLFDVHEVILRADDLRPRVLNLMARDLLLCPIDEWRNLERARELSERACAATRLPHFLDTLACVLYDLGQKQRAVLRMEEAIELCPPGPFLDHLRGVRQRMLDN